MKLTQEQIQYIENYLDRVGLKQLDVKIEVLDHICNGIEKYMTENQLTFIEAFEKEIRKWKAELKNHSSIWLGTAYSGPKIMIKKGAALVKQFYLKNAVFVLAFITLFYTLDIFSSLQQNVDAVNLVIGLYLLFYTTTTVILYIKLLLSKLNTTYRYVFKVHTLGLSLLSVLYNPLLFKSFSTLYFSDELSYPQVFIWGMLIATSFDIWTLSNSHNKIVKQQKTV